MDRGPGAGAAHGGEPGKAATLKSDNQLGMRPPRLSSRTKSRLTHSLTNTGKTNSSSHRWHTWVALSLGAPGPLPVPPNATQIKQHNLNMIRVGMRPYRPGVAVSAAPRSEFPWHSETSL